MTTYEPPTYEYLGSLRDLTLGTHTGNATDKMFPQNTQLKDMTFS